MAQETFFITEATTEIPIQEIEHYLQQLNGVERVLIDTNDGEVKIEYDEKKVSLERIIITLRERNFHIVH